MPLDLTVNLNLTLSADIPALLVVTILSALGVHLRRRGGHRGRRRK